MSLKDIIAELQKSLDDLHAKLDTIMKNTGIPQPTAQPNTAQVNNGTIDTPPKIQTETPMISVQSANPDAPEFLVNFDDGNAEGKNHPVFHLTKNGQTNVMKITTAHQDDFIDTELWTGVTQDNSGKIIGGSMIIVSQKDYTNELDLPNLTRKGYDLTNTTCALRINCYDESDKQYHSETVLFIVEP